jgi:hypothetical protein
VRCWSHEEAANETQLKKAETDETDAKRMRLKTATIGQAQGGIYSFTGAATASALANAQGGFGFASFLLGVPATVALRSGVVPNYYRWQSGAGFVQNDWKVRPNLTLNFGLRYDLQLPRSEKYDLQAVFRPDLAQQVAVPAGPILQSNGAPVVLPPGLSLPQTALIPPLVFAGHGRSQYLLPVDKTNFQPRFGFAWRPEVLGLNHADSRPLVVRGGYGISYLPLTGQDRNPDPDFGIPAQQFGTNSGQVNPNYVMRLSSNPPALPPLSIEIPANGIMTTDSLRFRGATEACCPVGDSIQAYAVAPNSVVGYVQNWNLTVGRELAHNMIVEAGYMGQKGTHLFMPPENINRLPYSVSAALQGAGLNPTQAVRDPLGRKDATGAVINVTLQSLFTNYMGFDNMAQEYDSSGDSIHHAGYISLQKRSRHGLQATANYTFGKTIDDASAEQTPSIATSGTNLSILPNPQSQIEYGGSRKLERSVAQYDIRHVFASTFVYEMPFGKGKTLLGRAPRLVEAMVGGWTFSGVYRLQSGLPIQVYYSDTNYLDGFSGVRPDVVAGAPIINPLWSSNCPTGNTCQPCVNWAAFVRPPAGQIGDAPRTFDYARFPWRDWFDLSVRKSFSLGKESRRRFEIRGDALNVLNHPCFLSNPNSGPYMGGGAPSEALITAAQFNT